MQEQFNQAIREINSAESVLLTTHERTDGDDLGTVLAFKSALASQGKHCHVAIQGGVPRSLQFLPGSADVTELVPDQKFDVLIVSGCSQKERVGNMDVYAKSKKIINIDHHPDNSQFGHINIVDHGKSAVAELTYDFFNAARWPMTHEVATCLLTGIFTDTGSFMHSNTTPSTLEAAASLMRKGAHTARIAKNTYKDKNVDSLKAWSKAFSNTWYKKESKIIYAVLTEEDLLEIGNPPAAVFEGFVETLNKVPEAGFALFLKQDGPIIKGSLRSDPHKNVDVGALARTFGGGGHKWASGFSVVGKLTRDNTGEWQVIEPTTKKVQLALDNIKPR